LKVKKTSELNLNSSNLNPLTPDPFIEVTDKQSRRPLRRTNSLVTFEAIIKKPRIYTDYH